MEPLSELLKQFRVISPRPADAAVTSSNAETTNPSAANTCLDCEGIRWVRRDVPVDHADFGKLFPCHCLLEQFNSGRFNRLSRYSNLGNLSGITFEGLEPPVGIAGTLAEQLWRGGTQVARSYAEEPKGWLVLTGAPGSGKTRIAAAIANDCIRRGNAVVFVPVADLLDHLRSTYAPNSEVTYDMLFEQVRNVPVLVLDDLGQESATPWAQEKLSQIMNHRYNAGMPTVITTDVPVEKLDERIRARFLDTATCHMVRLAGGRSAVIDSGVESLNLFLPRLTFETFKPDGGGLTGPIGAALAEAYDGAKRWSEKPDGWFVIIGGHGSGKTHLASAIANRCRQRGDGVLFLLVPELLDFLRSTVGQEGNPSYAAFQHVERVPVLVMDDLTESLGTPWTSEKLDLLLNHRYLNRLPTVITSSLSPDQMQPRIWSRISDVRLSNVYEIVAPDYRTGREYPRSGETEQRPRPKPKSRGGR